MVGDTILIKDISINGNDELKNASDLSKELTDKTINALGIDASSRTIWINGQPYGNAYVNVKEGDTIENPIGGEIFNDFEHNIASGDYSHAEGKGTVANNEVEHAEGKYNKSNNNTIHSVGIGTSDNDRKNAEEIHYDSGDKYVIGIGGYDGTNSTNTTVKTVQTVVNESINQITISYLKLKELRDASKLVPGKEYRINDYTCTTTQAGTRSAGNDFDIIVTADSESTLNEEARAINHEFDNPEQDHFKDCNLAAWKLWYCLDNDTNRFAWADTNTNADNNENGKGVIYRMIDEFNNECPYDFKNIQFYRAWDDSLVSWSIIPDETTTTSIKPCYTFSSSEYGSITASTSEFIDASLKESNRVYSNIIKSFTKAVWPVHQKQFLNNNCLFYTNTYSNTLGTNCYNNTFIDCSFNILETGCYNNLLHRGIYNTLKTYCYNNVLRNNSNHNTLGNNCYNNRIDGGNYNRLGDDCYNNALINDCSTNTFGNSCYSNKFLDDCTQNYFGNGCYENSFSFRVVNNSFGNNCYNNTFGQDCSDNALGNNCNNNAFGSNCSNSAFGNSCNNIKFAPNSSTGVRYDYYQNNRFGDNCKYIVFKGEERASQTAQVQNYNFAQGLQGTETEYLSIDGKRGREYDTYISLDTNTAIKESVIADKLDKMIEISYKELYDLRESGGLIPGQQYRITDYICTTNQSDTSIRTQQNKFDIIVTADNESVLNEEARAIWNDNDNNYFKDCDLNAWKIWYSLDNDTTRFAWADATNGKGVIYRMIDEWNNDCPYDFKNIQFARDWSVIAPDGGLVGTIYCYTFSIFLDGFIENATSTDESVKAKECIVSDEEGIFGNNVIRTRRNIIKSLLNNIVFVTDWSLYSIIHYSNTFGYNCYNNTFGKSCYNNTFGNNCDDNTFGNDCYSNTFGNNCGGNTFGNDCYSNTFGNNCGSNTFGNDCYSNTFGNDCDQIKFTSDSSSAATKYHYYRNNHFGDGCQSILFKQDEDPDPSTASTIKYVQNYMFATGLNNHIINGERGREYDTYISLDSDEIKRESVIADKLDKMIEINYLDLLRLRESNGLIPGQQYRITDYECTITFSLLYTARTDKFDIIVTAVSTNKLNEEARAINHEFTDPNQDHFKDCKLSAWKIWYCLDNDTSRFDWANTNTTNDNNPDGRGVIYRMIDEFGNDCPYDFKNIQFYRKQDETTSLWSIIGTGNDSDAKPCYTFSSKDADSTGKFTDMSLNKDTKVYSNVIKGYKKEDKNNGVVKQTLNNICFFGNNCYNNIFDNDCYDSTFNSMCYNNTFSKTCHNNIFGESCENNIFGNNCSYNTFGYGFSYNTVGNYFGYIDYQSNQRYVNSFGYNCIGNSFGNKCGGNDFGNFCSYNTFGNYCRDNTFGDSCTGNSVGNYFGLNPKDNNNTNNYGNRFYSNCSGNSFGNICYKNTINDNCVGNTFGENCYLNNLCKGCDYNSFGNNCIEIKLFSYGGYNKNKHYQYNHFGDGCYNIGVFGPTENVNDSDMVQNYNFAQGLRPDAASTKVLTINTKLNLIFDTTISKGTDKNVYEYCLADVALTVSKVNIQEQPK